MDTAASRRFRDRALYDRTTHKSIEATGRNTWQDNKTYDSTFEERSKTYGSRTTGILCQPAQPIMGS